MSFRIIKDQHIDALVGDNDALFNHDQRIRGNLVVEGTVTFEGDEIVNGNLTVLGETKLNTIETNTLCFNDQLSSPVCNGTETQGCLWVADPGAPSILPPSAPLQNENPLHYQDSSCRDNIVETTPTDPFHGWWIKVSKGWDIGSFYTGNYLKSMAMFIDTTKSPIQVTHYGGTLDNLRELVPDGFPNPEIVPLTQFQRIVPIPVQGDTIQVIPPVNNPLTFPVVNLTMQTDKKTLVGNVNCSKDFNPIISCLLYYKLNKPPAIRPFNSNELAVSNSTSSPSSDPNNPVFMFDEFCDYQLIEQSMTNIETGYSQYPGYLAFRDTQYKLKTTGIVYTSNILKVQRTVKVGGPSAQNTGTPWIATTTQPPAPIYITVFETDIPHHANRFSRVTLAGFTGILSYLNGSRDVLCNDDTWTLDEDNNFMNPNTRKYRFTIEMDTCIPGTTVDASGFITNPFGSPTVSVQIGPITPGSEYRKLLEVQFDFFYNMFQFSTHSTFTWYRPSPTTGTATQSQKQKSIPTFFELQSRIRAGTATAGNINLRTVQHGSAMATNLNINQGSTGSQPIRQIVPLNNPYGITSTGFTSIFSYNIALENYLDKTSGFEARNIWWRLTGAAVTPTQQILGQAYYGIPTLGRTFEAVTWPISSGTSPNPAAPVNQQYFQMGNATRNNFNANIAQRFIFGRINPVYTGGKNIGYLRLQNTNPLDPLFGMSSRDLCPPGLEVANPRANFEALATVWAEGMKYLITTLGCTNIIFDNRCNTGGVLNIVNLASSFVGADRPGGEKNGYDALRDTGFSQILQGASGIYAKPMYEDTLVKTNEGYENILVSKSKAYYPGSVLESTLSNPNPKVYVLTDSRATSGGDVFPHYFLGNNAPPTNRQLGAGVKSKIFGDLNGILSGASANTANQTRKQKDFIVTNAADQPIAFNTYSLEALNVYLEKMANEPKGLNNRGPWLYPDTPEPAVNYLGSGPWDNSWEAVAYPYLGAAGFGPLIPRLPGDARPNPNPLPLFPAAPVPADRLLWRDSWLEQTVFDAIQP